MKSESGSIKKPEQKFSIFFHLQGPNKDKKKTRQAFHVFTLFIIKIIITIIIVMMVQWFFKN